MTLGERSLEREVLALFDRQAEMLLPRIRCGGSGAGRGVGPHLEGLGGRHRRLQGGPRRRGRGAGRGRGDSPAAIDTLAAVLEEAKAEIARLLRMI